MNTTDPVRWIQRFDNFKQALKQLTFACTKESYTDLEFAGLIKHFEIAYELAWKTLKDLLYFEGFDVKSPRATIQQAFESGYITNLEPWVEALASRNILSHTYDKNAANDAEILIKQTYLPMLTDILHKLKPVEDNT